MRSENVWRWMPLSEAKQREGVDRCFEQMLKD